MSRAEEIVGRMTQEETAELLRACLRNLPDELSLTVLSELLTFAQIDEVMEMRRRQCDDDE